MASRYEVVDEDRGGGQEGVASGWKTIRAVFPNFAGLPAKRGDFQSSAVLKCHGFEWTIALFPGGCNASSEEDAFVSIYLRSKSSIDTGKIKAEYKIRIPSADRRGGKRFNIFSPIDIANEGPAWGFKDYVKRDDVLDASKNYLVGGNLTVEVDIQVMLDKPPAWTPSNTLSPDMLAFLDAADADSTIPAVVTFEAATVDGTALFRAHGPILAARCPTLASLAEDCDPNTPIPIEDVQEDVFRMFLRYVYGGEVPSKEVINEQAKDIIRVADRFECTGLKLTVEAEMAAAGITTDNAAELVLFADATNCAMLKETAMEFFVENSQAVMASEGFEQVAESPETMREMMAAMASGSKKRPASSDADAERDYERMRVATLRQKLDEKKLDVDGSKDMLISRLEAAEAEARALAEAEARAHAEAQALAAEAENDEEDE